MKNISILLLVITLILGSTYQACCEACVSKLTIDANKQATDSDDLPLVKTYKVASKHADDVDPEGFCGKVFEKHGTCCNQADLKKRADAWSNRLKNRSEKIVKGFEKMDKLVDSIGKIKAWANSNKSKFNGTETTNSTGTTGGSGTTNSTGTTGGSGKTNSTGTGGSGTTNSTGTGGSGTTNSTGTNGGSGTTNSTSKVPPSLRILLQDTKNETNSSFSSENAGSIGKGKDKHPLKIPDATGLTKLEKELDKIKGGDKTKRQKREKDAKGQAGDCHKQLMKMRKAALCMRCSGIASDFYEATTGSYKIKENICSTLLDKCATVFAAIAEANNLFTNLAILKKVHGGAVSEDAEADLVTEEGLGKWQGCGDDKGACLKDKAKVKDLCGQISLSIDNQKLEGNLATTSEGIEAGEAIDEGKDMPTAEAEDFFKPAGRLLDSKVQYYTIRNLEDAVEDDGYGYAVPSDDGADLESDFSSGVTITKMLSFIFVFAGIMAA